MLRWTEVAVYVAITAMVMVVVVATQHHFAPTATNALTFIITTDLPTNLLSFCPFYFLY